VYELREAKLRQEIVEGLGLAVDAIDRVIAIIRKSPDPDEAKKRLCAEPLTGLGEFLRRAGRPEEEIAKRVGDGTYYFSERQAQAILEMRLSRLTGLEREKLESEYRELAATIDYLESILADEKRLMKVVIDELIALRDQYGDERRTEIVEDEGEIAIEELIAEEDMVVTVSHAGYVKRNPISDYRAQKRGGRGVTGASTKDEDFVTQLFVASTHDHLLLFTSTGRAFLKKVYELPEGTRAARGKALVNLLELREGERVVELLPIKKGTLDRTKTPLEEPAGGEAAEESESVDGGPYVFFATKKGVVKKTALSAFANIRSTGIIAIGIDDEDDLIEARLTDGRQHILLASREGFAIRFSEEVVRAMGRTARGVRGMGLRGKDQLVAMAVIEPESEETLITVCEHGYGKRTPLADYPQKGRAGKGVITIKTTERNGKVVGVLIVTDEDDLMLITNAGKVIRMPVNGIPSLGRNTQGVRLIRLEASEKVVAVERLAEREEDEARGKAEVEVLEGQEDLSDEEGVPDGEIEDPTERSEFDPDSGDDE
jgi:DNA gyrase subunit A